MLAESIALYQKIISDFPTSPLLKEALKNQLNARIYLADTYFKVKSYTRASNLYLSILEGEHDISSFKRGVLFQKLGEALYRKKSYSRAKKAFAKAQFIFPDKEILKSRIDRIL